MKTFYYLIFCFFGIVYLSYPQQQFKYLFYVDNTIREGLLFYDSKTNDAIYLDKISETKLIKDIDEDFSTASAGNNQDSYYFKKKNIIFFTEDLLKKNFLVEDELPEIKWDLTSEKKEIQNLVCYKAVARFRGTNWIVWYCPEIPITYGPWKFYGLPGLIIEARDETDRFAFTLVEIGLKENLKMPEINMFNSFTKTTLKKMVEDSNIAFENFLNTLTTSRSDENQLIVKSISSKVGIESRYEWEE